MSQPKSTDDVWQRIKRAELRTAWDKARAASRRLKRTLERLEAQQRHETDTHQN